MVEWMLIGLLITGFADGKFPVRYLGIPLDSKKLNANHYMPLIDKVMARIRHWTAKLLSIAGRIQLVKSTLTAIAQFWMASLPFPASIIQKLESMCRSYIWAGSSSLSKKSPVAWKRVCTPIKQGGLSILNLQVWNLVAALKCLWKISMKENNLRVKWIHSYYLKGRDVLSDIQNTNCTWITKSIMASKEMLGRIGNLWQDMKVQKKFSMMRVYDVLIDDNTRTDWYHLLAHNFARPRAKVIMWLVCLNRLPTKVRLKNMGILQSSNCQLYNNEEEDLEHLMYNCSETAQVWIDTLKWMNMDIHQQVTLDWLKKIAKGKGWKNHVFKVVATEACYGIWMYRNSKIFENKGSYSDMHRVTRNIVDSIVYRGWMKPKYRKHIVNILM
ncbi:uncharacterized protein LOC131605815 [Vicia villosa]|uniref:uncharacterized protein LOC131605815 n=1 Tax=Vicia villosa TaxID=3911 RepID=UPI00273BA339|nr:uncharacterized protein LOC131605815 [Vicia villosa]